LRQQNVWDLRRPSTQLVAQQTPYFFHPLRCPRRRPICPQGHIHDNGQKAAIHWIPGVEYPAVVANSPILGTQYHIQDILTLPYTAGNAFGGPGTSPYHYKIDFTKPGAQEYMNSVVALFASWGIDFIMLDGVTPGSDSDSLSIDNHADVAAWSKAIAVSGPPYVVHHLVGSR
jgi:alpha-galactosidase